MKLFMMTVSAVVLLAACASPALQPNYYLLRSDPELQFRELNISETVSLGRLETATYLNQSGLVLEADNGTLRPARFHLWAEPIRESTRDYLKSELSRIMGEDIRDEMDAGNTLIVNMRLDQLHGTVDGQAHLAGLWTLERGKQVLSSYQYAEKLALSHDGYAALVAAQKQLLTTWAGKIAASINQYEASQKN